MSPATTAVRSPTAGPRARRPSERIDVDGSRLTLRPVLPTDAPALDAFVRGLSDRSAYHRFHGPRYGLSGAELAFLVNVDHWERETLVVTEPARGEVIAFGQYVGLDHPDDHGAAADMALAVADAWQGRGLGRALGRRLLAAAADAGFTVVIASILADNRPALALADRFRPGAVHPQGPTVEVQLDLDALARPSTRPRNRHACSLGPEAGTP